MADKKISQLSAASTPLAGTEVLPIVQSSATVKVSAADITAGRAVSALTYTSTATTGTAPLVVSSTTEVANLRAANATSADSSNAVKSNATTGLLQVVGPAAAATRVMTVPDANFTAARTDAGQTFTGVQVFTSPKVITSIDDTNGNEVFKVTATGSAVNEITVANAATGAAPTFSATGSDTNIDLTLTPKGTGKTNTGKLFAVAPETTSNTTPLYNVFKNDGFNHGGGSMEDTGIVTGGWVIRADTDTDIAPITIASGSKWRAIFIGAWGNYYEGFSVTGPGNYLEVTSDSNTFLVGTRTVTVTRNSTSGYLQWQSAAYGSAFNGTIIISSSGGGPELSINVKEGISALGTYSDTVGGTNRDLYIDNTGLIGYVSSTRESKTNIVDLSDVSWLNQLNPVEFNRRKKKPVYDKDEPQKIVGEQYSDEAYLEKEYGLIAEDAEIVNSELCFYDVVDGKKELRGVHYSKLIVPLLKKVQELEAQIKALSK